MPTSSQLVSIVTGLAVGNVFGLYLAQTYEFQKIFISTPQKGFFPRHPSFPTLWKFQLPNLHSLMEDLFSRAKQYEKSTKKSGDEKGR